MKKQILFALFLSLFTFGFSFVADAMEQRPLSQLTQAELNELKEARKQRLTQLSNLLKTNPEFTDYVASEADVLADLPDMQMHMNVFKRVRVLKRSANAELLRQQGTAQPANTVPLPQSP